MTSVTVADPGPDPHGSETFARIQQKVKEQLNKTVNSQLFVVSDCTLTVRSMK